MNADGRARRRELVDEAYKLQVKAGMMARHTPFEYTLRGFCALRYTSKPPDPDNHLFI